MSDNLGQHSGRITVLKLSSYLLFTEGSFTSVCTQLLRHVQLFEAPWTVAHQAPLSMGFFQARTLERVAISFSRGSSQHRIEPASLASPALADGFLTASATWEAFH